MSENFSNKTENSTKSEKVFKEKKAEEKLDNKKINELNKNPLHDDKTREIKVSLPKLPFNELAKQKNLSWPLKESLKTAYGWNNSTLLTMDELNEFCEKWLGLKPSDEHVQKNKNKRRSGKWKGK